jgi:hypothetical protein
VERLHSGVVRHGLQMQQIWIGTAAHVVHAPTSVSVHVSFELALLTTAPAAALVLGLLSAGLNSRHQRMTKTMRVTSN